MKYLLAISALAASAYAAPSVKQNRQYETCKPIVNAV